MDTETQPIFEVVDPNTNHVYQIWEDGRTTGFPPGCKVNNRILPALHQLQATPNKKEQ